jgi:DNA-binding NarL/FixJ family response regulator
LKYALEKQITYGIWGGSSPAERDAVAVNNGKINEFKGISLIIVQLTKKGVSANEIAVQLDTSLGYVRRVLRKLTATEQGAAPLHKQTKDSSKGLR